MPFDIKTKKIDSIILDTYRMIVMYKNKVVYTKLGYVLLQECLTWLDKMF